MHGNTPFQSMGWIKVTCPAPPMSSSPDNRSCPTEWRWRHSTKPRSWEQLKILPFANRKQREINIIITIMFIPWLSSSLAHDQPLHTPGDALWTAGWVIKAQDPESHTPTGMAGWRESMQMMPSKAHRSTSSQPLKVTLMTLTPFSPLSNSVLSYTYRSGTGTGSSCRACLWTTVTSGVHRYEPVPTLDAMAPEKLLKVTSCNCRGYCSDRRCSCK